MKVGFFHDHIFTNKNGIRYTSGTLDKELWERYFLEGVKTVFVCCREKMYKSGEKLGAVASSENVIFEPSPSLSSLSSLLFGVNENTVKRVVEEVDYVVVRLPSEIGFTAVKYAKKFKKVVICEVVGCPFDGLNGYGTIKAKLYAPIIRKRMRNCVSSCDGALYVTEYALQKKYPHDNSENASNVSISHVNYDCLESRKNRLKNSKIINIGLIGALDNDIKGVDIAIKSLKSLNGVRLRVLGKGDPSRFEVLADKYGVEVYFDGFISEKSKIFEWLDLIDIYIQPSFQEGLPRATIEAMSRGCIVASSNAGGLDELTLSEFIHTPGDSSKLSKDILEIINSSIDEKESYIRHSLDQSSKYTKDILKGKRLSFYQSNFQR
ncbi:TPA: glycosyltransferase family 4 protein [Vibrio harveyi]|nr:glycosyltransferase family 4 protein [Vibrio harveyi]